VPGHANLRERYLQMNSELHYIALADQVRLIRERSVEFRKAREAWEDALTDEQVLQKALIEARMRGTMHPARCKCGDCPGLRGLPTAFQTLPGELDA